MRYLILLSLLLLVSCGSKHKQADIDLMWELYNDLKKETFYLKLEDSKPRKNLEQLKELAKELELDKNHEVVQLIKKANAEIKKSDQDIEKTKKIIKETVKEIRQEKYVKAENKVLETLSTYSREYKSDLNNPENFERDKNLIRCYQNTPDFLEKFPKLLAHVNLMLTIETGGNEVKTTFAGTHGYMYIKDKSTISKCGLAMLTNTYLRMCKETKAKSFIGWFYEDKVTKLLDTNKKHYLMYLNISKTGEDYHVEEKFNDKAIKNIFKEWQDK